MKKINKKISGQPTLFDAEQQITWPNQEQFPLNTKSGSTVERILKTDIDNSSEYLIITGFTSLSHLIDFFCDRNYDRLEKVRITLGWAPEERVRANLGFADLTEDLKNYWLDQNISIIQSGAVIRFIELIKNEIIKFKFSDKLHAKIYVSDSSAVLGSSNFSKTGLNTQKEANIRVTKNLENSFEAKLYEDIRLIAENFYEESRDYNKEILEILSKLLKITTWQESLARAINELINRDLSNDFPELYSHLNRLNERLWPSQKMAIGESLYILQTQGCVLIAEPTGSGKTKLISVLSLILFHWLWETGRKDRTSILTICPPLVKEKWKEEAINLAFAQSAQESMGLLSFTESRSSKNLKKQLDIANILIVDEAHNYLNQDSNRSKSITNHSADQIILATATPINKKAKDLIRLIELLGVDNLSDDESNNQLKKFEEIKRLTLINRDKDLKELREYIDNFIVRRTKSQLNKLIESEPDKYLNKLNKQCKYPKQNHQTYNTGETDEDIKIADKINQLCEGLKGIIYLQRIEKPEYQIPAEDIEKYISKRIEAAKSLAIFNIRSKLRSSHIALIEHIKGTEYAKELYKFHTTKSSSGNILQKLKSINKPIKTDFENFFLPDWLTDFGKYQNICNNEIEIYREICDLSKKISNKREWTKIKQLKKIIKQKKAVIAFDSTIITLDYLHYLIKQNEEKITTYVITGKTDKSNLLHKFSIGASVLEDRTLVLCSDTLSEGVDLQLFSVMLFLDMPSVLRIAEQRIGRIDRLDSPFPEINIYWPYDTDAFALKTDKKLIRTLIDAESLIGNNFSVPNEIMERHLGDIVGPDEMIRFLKDVQNDDYMWDGVKDAFRAVHDLYDGYKPLIPKETYLQLKDINVDIKVKLSIGVEENSWVFLAMRGNKESTPRWFFIDENKIIYSELTAICYNLMQRLEKVKKWRTPEDRWLNTTTKYLNEYIFLLQKEGRNLLPNRRKRALTVAEEILRRQRKCEDDIKRKALLDDLLNTFKPTQINEADSTNFYLYSQQWLDILSPYLIEKRKKSKNKNKVISLNNLIPDYRSIKLSVDDLERIKENVPIRKQPWNDVVACIITVPNKAE
ncbi:MAG: SNF2-related protein [Bacteroidia bacterium]|nr:SNF2-related protein [Bacteroidia bacterium]